MTRTHASRRAAYQAFRYNLETLVAEVQQLVEYRGRLPEEWQEISFNAEAERERITLRVDRGVLKFFRAMGPGDQRRIDRVLRAFVAARLAGIVAGPEATALPGERCPACGQENRSIDFEDVRRKLMARLDRLAEEQGEAPPDWPAPPEGRWGAEHRPGAGPDGGWDEPEG